MSGEPSGAASPTAVTGTAATGAAAAFWPHDGTSCLASHAAFAASSDTIGTTSLDTTSTGAERAFFVVSAGPQPCSCRGRHDSRGRNTVM